MKQFSNGRLALVFAAAASVVYVAMITGPLKRLAEIGGAPPFDMRPTGYGFAEAAEYLRALGPAGRHLYLTRQLPLDTLYPALLALTIIFTLRWSSGRFAPTPGQGLVAIFAVAAAAFDYAENAMIWLMLVQDTNISPRVVTLASAASVAKSVSTTIAVTGLLLCVAFGVWRSRSTRVS